MFTRNLAASPAQAGEAPPRVEPRKRDLVRNAFFGNRAASSEARTQLSERVQGAAQRGIGRLTSNESRLDSPAPVYRRAEPSQWFEKLNQDSNGNWRGIPELDVPAAQQKAEKAPQVSAFVSRVEIFPEYQPQEIEELPQNSASKINENLGEDEWFLIDKDSNDKPQQKMESTVHVSNNWQAALIIEDWNGDQIFGDQSPESYVAISSASSSPETPISESSSSPARDPIDYSQLDVASEIREENSSVQEDQEKIAKYRKEIHQIQNALDDLKKLDKGAYEGVAGGLNQQIAKLERKIQDISNKS